MKEENKYLKERELSLGKEDFESATLFVLVMHRKDEDIEEFHSTYFFREAAENVGEFYRGNLPMAYDTYHILEICGEMDEPDYRKYFAATLLWNMKLSCQNEDYYKSALRELEAFEQVYNICVVMPEDWHPALTTYNEIITNVEIYTVE